MTQRNLMGEALIEDLAETLQIPQSRYEAADRSYRSVADWLDRLASVLPVSISTSTPRVRSGWERPSGH